ncbi:MAG: hypothetical protein DYG89_40605 [Caldilinea sp. CFX5]|nr:hypothetical protein [Caldilinea sp. CFX5]
MSQLLTEATVQEIQLELIRRIQFNAFDGEEVVDSLQRHRNLWLAAVMESSYGSGIHHLSGAGLLKLRDLPLNIWHVDTLYVLMENAQKAHEFARIIDEEGWGEEIQIIEDENEVQRALGGGEPGHAIVSVWWD